MTLKSPRTHQKTSKWIRKVKFWTFFRQKIHFFRDFLRGFYNFNNLTHDFHFFYSSRLGKATDVNRQDSWRPNSVLFDGKSQKLSNRVFRPFSDAKSFSSKILPVKISKIEFFLQKMRPDRFREIHLEKDQKTSRFPNFFHPVSM